MTAVVIDQDGLVRATGHAISVAQGWISVKDDSGRVDHWPASWVNTDPEIIALAIS